MRCFGMLMDGRTQPTGIDRRGEDASAFLVLNAFHDVVQFTLPDCPGGSGWMLLVDTNAPDGSEHVEFAPGDVYDVTGRSVLLFVFRADGGAEQAVPKG